MPSPESLTHMSHSPKGEKTPPSQEELREKLSKSFYDMEPLIKEEIDKYKQALKDGTFEDKEDEEEGQGEKRKEEMQVRINSIVIKAEKMKERLDSSEPLQDNTLEDPTSFNTFLLDTYKGWGEAQDKLDTLNFSPELVLPNDLDYTTKEADIDATKFGEYTLNPDTLSLDYDTIPENKIKVITLPNTLNGKPLDEIANYILQTYPNHHIPGLEYYKYILENPNKGPQSLRDGNYHFFFGSLFRSSSGGWRVPYMRWGGSLWNRYGHWLASSWNGLCRVVVVETP